MSLSTEKSDYSDGFRDETRERRIEESKEGTHRNLKTLCVSLLTETQSESGRVKKSKSRTKKVKGKTEISECSGGCRDDQRVQEVVSDPFRTKDRRTECGSSCLWWKFFTDMHSPMDKHERKRNLRIREISRNRQEVTKIYLLNFKKDKNSTRTTFVTRLCLMRKNLHFQYLSNNNI